MDRRERIVQRQLLWRQAEALRGEATDRLLLPVDRLPLNEDGPDQHAKGFPIRDTYSPIPSRHEAIQSGVELEAVKEVADQRKRSLTLCRERETSEVEGLTSHHLANILSPDTEDVNP